MTNWMWFRCWISKDTVVYTQRQKCSFVLCGRSFPTFWNTSNTSPTTKRTHQVKLWCEQRRFPSHSRKEKIPTNRKLQSDRKHSIRVSGCMECMKSFPASFNYRRNLCVKMVDGHHKKNCMRLVNNPKDFHLESDSICVCKHCGMQLEWGHECKTVED